MKYALPMFFIFSNSAFGYQCSTWLNLARPNYQSLAECTRELENKNEQLESKISLLTSRISDLELQIEEVKNIIDR